MKKIFLVVVFAQSVSFAQNSNSSFDTDLGENQSVFIKNQKFDRDGVELYSSNLDLKNHKQLGLGLMIGGAVGLVGINAEINVEPTEAAVAGIGFGSGYNSFNLGWKHNFIGNYLSPYTKVGYSKWFNTTGGSNSASNSDILERVLSEQEIKDNRFSADFLMGSFGLEYNQLEGELSGVNLFGELAMMAEINKGLLIPTGAVGIIYYY
ncbi:MAG: hypothetical protein WA160_08260 [Pseudobdellovibrio sp.]